MTMWRKILLALIVAVAISAVLIADATGRMNKEPIEIPAEIAPVIAMAAAPELPDPCYLEAVVCPGERVRSVSAYTSEISQTDGSPCISASGNNICEQWQDGNDVCAANFVDFGTKLYVEGLGICTVLDRMNSRYPDTVDWYFGYDTHRAIEFGRQRLNVMVLDE